MKEAFLIEQSNVKVLTAPVDGAAAAIVGGRVSMKTAQRVSILIILAAGTGATVAPALKQYNAATGGTGKPLSIANQYGVKSGAETKITKVEPAVAADTYDLSTRFATDGGLIVLEVLQEDLDVNNGFTHVGVDFADMGTAAKLVTVVAITRGDEAVPAYSTDI